MSSTSPTPPAVTNKKPIRELSSITNQLLFTKTLNALVNNTNNNSNSSNVLSIPPPPPPPSTSSIKENIPNDPNLIQQQKALNLRLAAALKPADRDNVAALFQFYQTLATGTNQTNPTFGENTPPPLNNNISTLKQQHATRR